MMADGSAAGKLCRWYISRNVTVVACMHLGFWALNNPNTTAASVGDRLPSVSYNRFGEKTSDGLRVTEVQIRTDLTVIAAHATAVRTYGSTRGLERIPEIAVELGLKVTLGIWIDKDNARNEHEIATALELARRYPNVARLVVGNETLFRHEHTAAELVQIIQRVKRESPVPVATEKTLLLFKEYPAVGFNHTIRLATDGGTLEHTNICVMIEIVRLGNPFVLRVGVNRFAIRSSPSHPRKHYLLETRPTRRNMGQWLL
jgi:hypothetical protein